MDSKVKASSLTEEEGKRRKSHISEIFQNHIIKGREEEVLINLTSVSFSPLNILIHWNKFFSCISKQNFKEMTFCIILSPTHTTLRER